MNNDTIEQLSCPICFELPISEIYQCRNGHAICKTCSDRDDMTHCPTCREEYDDPKIRNRVAEGLLENMEMACRHSNEGCTLVLAKRELAQHLLECEFRPVALCKALGIKDCNFTSASGEAIFQHIEACHDKTVHIDEANSEAGWALNKYTLFVESSDTPFFGFSLWRVNFGDRSENFIVCRSIHQPPDHLSLFCIYMGQTEDEAEKYRTDFIIKDVTSESVVWKWTGAPMPFKDADNWLDYPPFRIPLRHITWIFGDDDDTHVYHYICIRDASTETKKAQYAHGGRTLKGFKRLKDYSVFKWEKLTSSSKQPK